jgi:hypothetical protein
MIFAFFWSNVTTIIKKENLTKISIKKILKNPEKGQLLSDFRKMIHFLLPFRIMVDNFSHHRTWLYRIFKKILLSNFLFVVTEVAMFDGSSNH